MSEELERVYTINLGKALLSQPQHRAVRALNMIREFARRHMKTHGIKIDEDLARLVWARGARHPPRKLRVRMSHTDTGDILVTRYDALLDGVDSGADAPAVDDAAASATAAVGSTTASTTMTDAAIPSLPSPESDTDDTKLGDTLPAADDDIDTGDLADVDNNNDKPPVRQDAGASDTGDLAGTGDDVDDSNKSLDAAAGADTGGAAGGMATPDEGADTSGSGNNTKVENGADEPDAASGLADSKEEDDDKHDAPGTNNTGGAKNTQQ